MERNHTLEHYKQKARETLLSEIGGIKRKKRTADVEPVFAHIKYNRNLKRFTHIGSDKSGTRVWITRPGTKYKEEECIEALDLIFP